MSLHIMNDGLHDYQLFVHIPKTGGTSIRQDRQLNPVAEFYKPPASWTYTRSFAVIRDPYERFASAYMDFRHNRKLIPDVVTPYEWLEYNIGKDVENPGSAGHHIEPMVSPIHGLIYAKELILFEDYAFDRRLRTSPHTFEWNHEIVDRIAHYYADDIALYQKVKQRNRV